jgi:hypothetical protein
MVYPLQTIGNGEVHMRNLLVGFLLTATLLLFGASSASALSFTMALNGGSAPASPASVSPSDAVIVDIFLDANVSGLEVFSVAVLYDDDGILGYQPGLSSVPGYILYTPASGSVGGTALVPNFDPPASWSLPPTGSRSTSSSSSQTSVRQRQRGTISGSQRSCSTSWESVTARRHST